MLCMSKTGDSLRNYTRMYPGLVNNTTIIWYMPWPEEALLEVANKYLKTLTLQDKIKEVPLKAAPPVYKSLFNLIQLFIIFINFNFI